MKALVIGATGLVGSEMIQQIYDHHLNTIFENAEDNWIIPTEVESIISVINGRIDGRK